jgi:hypothetical protein
MDRHGIRSIVPRDLTEIAKFQDVVPVILFEQWPAGSFSSDRVAFCNLGRREHSITQERPFWSPQSRFYKKS